MNRILKYALTLLISLVVFTMSAAGIPDKPKVERLVNDFAGILSPNTVAVLEDSLVRVSNRTSTQIVVVTVNSLDGYDVSQFAYTLGEKWGVGGAKNNNGVVILVKPKTPDSRGQAFIATGYGLEGVLPDIICGRIVNDIMIPYFKRNDYQGGITAGTYEVIKRVQGEYTADPYDEEIDWVTILILFGIIGLFLYITFKDGGNSGGGRGRRRYNDHITYSNDSFIFGGGGFSGGSSRGGGFGGFGGGHFGGGGGGGSW